MTEDVITHRPTLSTYEEIDAALNWLRRYTKSKTELCTMLVQYYAVDLDMLANRLQH
ncbi:MAG: hypothetical protein P4L82_07090 [Ancalomicrobiaceae bacterium]|nr:hypothetical protein [Ancalomicrobiaceae bacterium]